VSITLLGADFFSIPMFDPVVIGLIKSNLSTSLSLYVTSSFINLCFPFLDIEKKLNPVLAAIAGSTFFLYY